MQKDKDLRSRLDVSVTSNGLLVAQPKQGFRPEKPDKPDNPVKPEIPDKPEKPDEPENPVKPEIPDKPEIQKDQSLRRSNQFHNECLRFKG
jgi:hypothetical protein